MAQPVTERAYQGKVHAESRRLMTAWMEELGRAEAERRVTGALMISGNCVELLRACHVLPMFPEVTALQNAIRHKSLPLILKAEQIGYSSDNCAYVKADVGLVLEGGFGPGKALPFPNLIVCNYVGCNVYVKWFEHLADISGGKLFMLDVPFARTDAPSADDIRYVVTQLQELIALCEAMTGRRFDIDELREVLALSARAQDGYARCKHLTKHHPAPFDSYFDSINMMGPINVLRGTPGAAAFFEDAVAEFEGLAAQKLGPLSEERFRTVVEGPPPYPFYKSFRNLFTKWGAVAVQSTYSTVGGIWEFGFRHDPREPHQPVDRRALRADPPVRRGLAGGRPGHSLDQVVPAVFRGAGRHARALHQGPRRADAARGVGPRRSALLRGGPDQEPRRRLLRGARAQEAGGGPLTCAPGFPCTATSVWPVPTS
jgi:benzoyl-CoA reductase subunit B